MTQESSESSRQIGQYHLEYKIGEGGMGVVWAATQQQPLRRVAIKLLKERHLDSSEVVARMERERDALARLNHPNIAAVFDAGTAPDGRPYFVMQFVEGLPLTAFCDQSKNTLSERLDLFIAICRAVQHAHSQGIIHRDLKPSNILVTLLDGKPNPIIIDFGIAKAVDLPTASRQVFTQEGVLLGTLPYISPEQAEGRSDVDGRTDVYSLGVIFYELLTGTLPLDWDRLRSAGYRKMVQLICTEQPPSPSLRLSRLGKTSASKIRSSKPGGDSGSAASRASAATVVHDRSSERRQASSATGTSTPASTRHVLDSAGLDEVATARHVKPELLLRQVRGDLDVIALCALEKSPTRRYANPGELADDIERFLRHQPIRARKPSVAYKTWKFVRRHRAAAIVTVILLASGGVSASLVLSKRDAQRLAKSAVADKQTQAAEHAVELAGAAQALDTQRAATAAAMNDQGVRLMQNAIQLSDEAQKETYQKAEREFLGAIESNPRHWQAFVNLANLRRIQFDLTPEKAIADDAISYLDQALTINPNQAEAYNSKGYFLRSTNRYEEAVTAYRQAMELNRDYYPTYVSLANALVAMGKFDDAREQLRLACERPALDGDNRPWQRFHNLAALELAFGDPRFEAALKSAGEHQGDRVYEVCLLRAKSRLVGPGAIDPSSAMDELAFAKRLSESAAADFRLHRLMAWAALQMGNWESALASAREALRLNDPVPAFPQLMVAIAASRLGDRQSAADALEAGKLDQIDSLSSGGMAVRLDTGLLWVDSKFEWDQLSKLANGGPT